MIASCTTSQNPLARIIEARSRSTVLCPPQWRTVWCSIFPVLRRHLPICRMRMRRGPLLQPLKLAAVAPMKLSHAEDANVCPKRSVTYKLYYITPHNNNNSTNNNNTKLPSNLRHTTRDCVHLVTVTRAVTSGHVTKMAVTSFNPP